ncbi:hypothetical protein AGMMS49936_05910 [Endomicrobiia bacterium]|nr:hypothetical protein AGMMS49936_05910 [Endomicrobiia bacterium]
MRKMSINILIYMILILNGNLFAASYDAYKIFLQGSFDYGARDIDNAITNYEKVIALDKNAFAVYKKLVWLYYDSGNTDKAFQIADKINDLDGNNPQTTIFLSEFYFFVNKLDISKQFCEKTIKLDPDNKTAMVHLAFYYYLDKKFKESIKYWNMLLQKRPDDAVGYLGLGMAQEGLAMYEAALKSYDQTIRIHSSRVISTYAYIAKAHIYETIGKADLVVKEYEKYMSAYPNSALALMCLGEYYYKTKNYTKAKDYFLKAKKYDRSNTLIVNSYLGNIYEQTGQFDNAIAEFEIIAATENKNISVLREIGRCYFILKKYSKAEKTFLKALDIAPLNNEILYLTAVNYIDWKKYNKAIEYLNKTIKLVPNSADAYFYLGFAYNENKDFENAEKALLKAIEINPDHSRAMNYLGYTYADKGIKLKESEKLIARAVALEPKNSIYLDSSGWLCYRQGKFDLAEKLLLEAVDGMKCHVIYDHLGDNYVALNKISQAWIAYSLSYDFKQDKNVKKKLNLVQAKMSQEELYKQMLLRSKDNYTRLLSFKTGFKVKLGSNPFSKNFLYIPFSYTQSSNVKIEFPATVVMGGISISIKNGKAKITPEAFKKEIPSAVSNFILQACDIFSDNFYKQFSDAKITRKGNSLIYSRENAKLTLNMDTALIESLSQNGMVVRILKYEDFCISKIPTKIKVISKNMNTKLFLEGTKISPIDDIENENKSSGSGKN